MEKLRKTAVTGKVRWQQWQKLKESARQHPKRSAIALVLLVVLVASVGILWWRQAHRHTSPPTFQVAKDNGYKDTIDALTSQKPPEDPLERIYYYSQIAQSYSALEKYDESLKFYLEGQAVIDLYNLQKEATFYDAIATVYAHMGKKSQADSFRAKAAERLKKYPTQSDINNQSATLGQ